jgi:peptidoglycan/LPS O-acetylase OafA/YrhL
MAERELYIDRIRTVLTATVVVFHAAVTYGASGGWFYHEVKPSAAPASLLMTFFVSTNQAYFMGFFFLLAGYFTPPSLERKGYRRFIVDRLIRLGLPLLAFGLLLGPITVGLGTIAKGNGFWAGPIWLWHHHRFINGPLWFAEALILMSVAYCGWRAVLGAALTKTERAARPVSGYLWWLASAVGVGAVACLLRQFVPVGQDVIGLQLGYFSSYIFLFAVGVAAWRYEWLRQLNWRNAWPWMATLLVAWPALPVGILVAIKTIGPEKMNFSGGPTWPAILYAFWEPFVAWGIIAAYLLIFRELLNRPSTLWSWLGRRAYAVYIIHPVVLVGVSLLFRGWTAPALAKWGVVGPLACIVCWLVADPLVRLPGLRRVI